MKRSKEEQRRYSMSAAGPSSFMNGTGWYDYTQTNESNGTSLEDLVTELQSLIPSFSQSTLLVNVFLEKINPTHQPVDGEIFLQQHLNFWKLEWTSDPSSLDPHWLAVFFAVLGLALFTGNSEDYKSNRRKEKSDDSDDESDDDMPLAGVYEVALGWMHAAHKFVYLGLDLNARKGEKPSLDSIRALLLISTYGVLIASTSNGLADPNVVKSYMELAINIANDLHLSRELEDKEDVNYSEIGTPIEDTRVLEDRRRLWWCLIRLSSEMQWMLKGWSTLGRFLIGGPRLPTAGSETDRFWVQGLHFRTNCAYLLRKAQTMSSTRPNRTCTLQQTLILAQELQGARDAIPNALLPSWDGVGKVNYGSTDPVMLVEIQHNVRYLCLAVAKILRPHRNAELSIREKIIYHCRLLMSFDSRWKHPYSWASPSYSTLHCMLTLGVMVFEMEDQKSALAMQLRSEIRSAASKLSKRLTTDPHVKKAYKILEFLISSEHKNAPGQPKPHIQWTSALEELIPPALASVKFIPPAPVAATAHDNEPFMSHDEGMDQHKPWEADLVHSLFGMQCLGPDFTGSFDTVSSDFSTQVQSFSSLSSSLDDQFRSNNRNFSDNDELLNFLNSLQTGQQLPEGSSV
ncbi:hypothetical protein BT69DRAFT_1346353 [Atractiella rhizophila]|nr:hypothetical protein BT69DRAFT_1346353 [Atractiella rhizophila]